MDTQNILNELDTRSKSADGLTTHQKILHLALGESEFLSLLPDEERNFLANVNGNPGQYLDNLEQQNEFRKLRLHYLTHSNDKIRRVSEFAKKLGALESRINNAQAHIDNIEKTSGDISGATALTAYAKQFKEEAAGHKKDAEKWRDYLYWSILGLVILLAGVLFLTVSELHFVRDRFSDDIRANIDIAAIVIKLGLIIGWTQVIRFFSKNYNAEKHLEQVALHRKNVLQSLHAVHRAITEQPEKDSIVKIGAAVAFQANETGYITRKEGAGGHEDILAQLLERIK